MQKFSSVDELVRNIQPVDPVYCIRPESIKTACSWFKKNFPGKILYAVKTTPHENLNQLSKHKLWKVLIIPMPH